MSVLLSEGDVIEIRPGHTVYAMVQERYVYENTSRSHRLAHTEVTVGRDMKGYDTRHLAGRYVVVKTTYDGGGTGHGPHDVYPNGHHVFCEKINGGRERVDFYQTGAFTAMIPSIPVVAKMKRRWVKT